jgi:glutamate-1-semialdehyde 2,1-aminomutase
MSTTTSSNLDRFIATHQKSRELWERSLKSSRGIHHDSRHTVPFQVYTSHANGSHRWDIDGNEYIDYSMGHGSLILGHSHPTLVEAVSLQVRQGTHYGTENTQAVEWAELICRLIPAAERVEFVLTGTEADIMIAQLARAYTGRNKILKFSKQFFGWSDALYVGVIPPFDQPLAGRLPPIADDAITNATVVIPCNDDVAMEKALARKDIAAFFLEGGGAHGGGICMPSELVQKARRLTQETDTLLVIDEVISGFRWSPGGYQTTIGVTPDLTPLGKIVSGGIGGGAAVCGRADIMDLLKMRPDNAEWNRYHRIFHNGTWNSNPLNATAGVTMLNIIAKGEVQPTAEASARKLADGMNHEIEKRGIDGCAFNTSSVLHLHMGKCRKCDRTACYDVEKSTPPDVINALHWYLLLNGVSMLRGTVGWVSAVHTEEDISRTVASFGCALDSIVADGVL